MRVLVGTIYVGTSKRYCLDKFWEMSRAVFSDVDVAVVTDQTITVPSAPNYVGLQYQGPPSTYATVICDHGKRQLREYALSYGYDYLVYQGVDCFYRDHYDFEELLRVASTCHITGALVAGRDKPDYPVCREFVMRDGEWTTEEVELPHSYFSNRRPAVFNNMGYVGSDATVLSRWVMGNVDVSGYQEWSEHRDEPHWLGPDEWLQYRAIKDHGVYPVIHCGVRPYHAYEDGTCARYKGETCPLEDLHWTGRD